MSALNFNRTDKDLKFSIFVNADILNRTAKELKEG